MSISLMYSTGIDYNLSRNIFLSGEFATPFIYIIEWEVISFQNFSCRNVHPLVTLLSCNQSMKLFFM